MAALPEIDHVPDHVTNFFEPLHVSYDDAKEKSRAHRNAYRKFSAARLLPHHNFPTQPSQ